MTERGLEPDFSAAAKAEADAITKPASESSPSIKDLTGLLWASIDNDDSRDLDQLSVAEPLASGAVKIFVAVADVDATVKKDSAIDGHAQPNTTSVYTAAQIFPMLPEKLSTDLTSLGEGQKRLAIVIEMVVGADGAVTDSAVYRAVVLNRAKLAYNSVAAWLDGTAPPPAPLAAVRGLDETDARARPRRAGDEEPATPAGRAEPRNDPDAALFDGDVLADLLPDEKNRAKELIEDFMIAANGVTAKYLEAKGFPRCAGSCARRNAGIGSSRSRRQLGERLPAQADAGALEDFLVKRRHADALRFPDLSLSVVKLLGLGRIRGGAAGADAERTLRAGGTRLHPLHRAQPALSGSHHATAAQGGARRPADRV